MSIIICIDPGHGGSDPGAVNGIRYEKEDNLKLALALKKQLLEHGCNVILTRDNDSSVSLSQRADTANKSNADLFISLHRNSATMATANGVETYIRSSYDTNSQAVAQAIQNKFVETGVQSNRGVKTANFQVLREANMPAILIELGFISNLKDNQMFDDLFHAYVTAITNGIAIMFNLYPTQYSHWAKPKFDYLKNAGVELHEERFDDNITRGEVFALLTSYDKARGK